MLERFYLLNRKVSTVLLSLRESGASVPDMLTSSELDVVDDCIGLSSPFEQVTKELSADKYSVISKVIPIVMCIISTVDKFLCSTVIGKQLKNNLIQELDKRFRQVESVTLLAISTLLDPRFKSKLFRDSSSLGRSMQRLKEECRTCENIISQMEEFNVGMERTTRLNTASVSDFWSLHTDLVEETSQVPSHNIDSEIKSFLSSPLLSRSTDPLHFWQSGQGLQYPNLKRIALKCMSGIATSVSSERLFSKAGHIINEKRNRLGGPMLNKLLFLQTVDSTQWAL